MNSKHRTAFAAGGSAASLLLVMSVIWRVSAGHAAARSTDLVSASADLVRCAAGDEAKFERASVDVGFRRRMVGEIPDVAMTADCELAYNAVKAKSEDYGTVWFGSGAAKGKDGKALGEKLKAALEALGKIPYATPTDKVLRKREQHADVLQLGNLAFDAYEAASELLAKDGASQAEVKTATEKHFRETRKAMAVPSTPKQLFSVRGKVEAQNWSLVPSDAARLMLFVRSEKDQFLIGSTDDAGKTWQSTTGLTRLAGKKGLDFRAINAPNKERWYVVSYEEGGKTLVGIAKTDPTSKTFAEPIMLPEPPGDWKRPRGGEREAVVLANGLAAMPVWHVGEVSKKKKKALEKEHKEWEKNFGDPAIQLEMMLRASRDKAREALGLDGDHERVDGLMYVTLGGGAKEVQVKELADYGIGGLIAGSSPQVLLGKGGIPALEVALGAIPAPGTELGAAVPAKAPKPANPAFRAPTWFGCVGADGTTYGLTEGGTILMGMKPGMLEVVQMTALADDGSHVGCGAGAAIIALPFQKDRIFASVLTIRLGEIEGAKVASTAGTRLEEYNRTVSAGVIPGTVEVAWVADGFLLGVTSKNWGTEFRAPEMLAMAGDDGSRISGVRLIGMDKRFVAVFTRESCSGAECTTSFEMLVSDDEAKTWKTP